MTETTRETEEEDKTSKLERTLLNMNGTIRTVTPSVKEDNDETK